MEHEDSSDLTAPGSDWARLFSFFSPLFKIPETIFLAFCKFPHGQKVTPETTGKMPGQFFTGAGGLPGLHL